MFTRMLTLVLLLTGAVASADNFYSFLWVVDNSPSLSQKVVAVLSDAFPEFLHELDRHGQRPVSFRMAASTVDVLIDAGKLVTGTNGASIVDSRSANPVGDFAALLNGIPNTAGSFWEQGLESGFLALTKYGDQFLVNDRPLIVVYVTDADDYSCAGKCTGVEPEHNPDWLQFPVARYTKQFEDLKASRGIQVSTFSLVGTPDSTCAVESNGYRYSAVQPAGSFGKTASICPDKLRNNYLEIARTIARQP